MRVSPFVLSAMVVMTVGHAQDWKKTLEESLASNYELTKTGMDRVRITKPGTVFVVRKDNINGDVASSMFQFVNKVMPDGTIVQGSGEGNGRVFKVGEKVYLFKIDVKNDGVHFGVISADTYQVVQHGADHQTRYKAVITFQFPSIETMTPEAIKKAVSQVISTEAEADAAHTKTVQGGMTPQEVEGIIGKPDTVLNLGTKMTYVYKNMKVVFQDGKVVDLQ
jgi:hypothetical protein